MKLMLSLSKIATTTSNSLMRQLKPFSENFLLNAHSGFTLNTLFRSFGVVFAAQWRHIHLRHKFFFKIFADQRFNFGLNFLLIHLSLLILFHQVEIQKQILPGSNVVHNYLICVLFLRTYRFIIFQVHVIHRKPWQLVKLLLALNSIHQSVNRLLLSHGVVRVNILELVFSSLFLILFCSLLLFLS